MIRIFRTLMAAHHHAKRKIIGYVKNNLQSVFPFVETDTELDLNHVMTETKFLMMAAHLIASLNTDMNALTQDVSQYVAILLLFPLLNARIKTLS